MIDYVIAILLGLLCILQLLSLLLLRRCVDSFSSMNKQLNQLEKTVIHLVRNSSSETATSISSILTEFQGLREDLGKALHSLTNQGR
jgi:hypothetical protein